MVYSVLRFLSLLAVWINFRKVYLENAERIPAGKHVIYGLNHPTAFLDPIVLGTHLPEKAWFMLRGDKFVNGPVRSFLHAIHNLPIYRKGDGGLASLKANIDTMSFATDRILNGEPTVILSEGVCRHERRLRPIQRGTARMLFQAQRKAPAGKQLAIVPAAINFTSSNSFRSSVTVSIGEPIFAADYAASFRADPRQAVEDVTAELQRRLRQLVIHVENPQRADLVEKLLPLIQHGRPDSGIWPRSSRSPFTQEQWRVVEVVNAMDDFEATAFERSIDAYLARLTQLEVSDHGIALPSYASPGRALLLWLSGPLAMLGWLWHYPLAMIVQRRTERMIRNPQFYSSVRWGMGMGAWVIHVLFWGTVAGVLVGWFVGLLVPILSYGLAYGYLVHRDAFELWKQAAKTRSLAPGILDELQTARRTLLAQVNADPA